MGSFSLCVAAHEMCSARAHVAESQQLSNRNLLWSSNDQNSQRGEDPVHFLWWDPRILAA